MQLTKGLQQQRGAGQQQAGVMAIRESSSRVRVLPGARARHACGMAAAAHMTVVLIGG
eukprot:CAMPEP_0179909624 /NCGR_PEP_ID=MMETSP0982-20121206/45330_1 /TAXON_ID=483367 /ORGANISM="non described non described, Strain CCMP 2436" /LENGTH=57 /DNA_ID=CAMNT_0021811117 /DNA_START=20 /DNA_END=191 /DNA_ORIENTATION=+